MRHEPSSMPGLQAGGWGLGAAAVAGQSMAYIERTRHVAALGAKLVAKLSAAAGR
jgi:hypothetical protein